MIEHDRAELDPEVQVEQMQAKEQTNILLEQGKPPVHPTNIP
jgi:hypothetical protein